MKKITLFFAFLLATFSWQTYAQTLNQPANWPNANWTLNAIAHTGATAQDVEADPTTDANFAYDDDDTGMSSHDEIAAESPVIDVTAAHTAGENILHILGDYVYNNIDNDEYLAIEYWDADASAWNLFYQFPNAETAGAPTDNYCGGTPASYDATFDVSAFTATQLSGFKYRFIYNDDTTGGNGWKWGFCFSSPTLISSMYGSIQMDVSLDNADCANSQFTVTVNVTDLGGASSVTITDDQGSAAQQLMAAGTATFGPYPSATTVSFTATNDQDTNISANDSFVHYCPPANDDCDNAIALTVNPDEQCGTVTHANNVNATASSQADDVTGTPNDDVWFSFVATNATQIISLSNITAVTGDSIDMGMGLYDGSAGCAGLTLVADSDPNTLTATGLTVGTTYYLRVYGWGDTFSAQATFDVCVGSPSPAPNCADTPTPVDAATAVAVGSRRSVALSWVAPTTGPAPTGYKVEIGTTSGTYTASVNVTDPTVTFIGFSENTTYYWKVTPINGTTEAVGCPEWSFTTDAFPTIANDNCSSAETLTLDADTCATSISVDNSFATHSGVAAPSCGSYDNTATFGDLWYAVSIPAGVTEITFENSNQVGYSSVAGALYSGDCTNLTEVSCTEFNSGWPWTISNLTSGDTYYLRVWDYNNNDAGSFDLCGHYVSASIADNQIKGFKFFPNPVNNVLNMTAKDNIEAVSITNITGQEVMNVTPNALETQVNMSQLQNGIYFVKVQVNGQVTAFKVIKK